MIAVKKTVVLATALSLFAVATFAQDSTKAEKPAEKTKATGKVEATATKAEKATTSKSAGAKVENKAEAKFVTTTSGLKYIDRVIGTGAEAVAGKKIAVAYTGWLYEKGAKVGDPFDSSKGRQPYQLTLGRHEVIQGWDEGLAGMKQGGKRELIIPPDLGYGKRGFPGAIPPDATLFFEVEMVKVAE